MLVKLKVSLPWAWAFERKFTGRWSTCRCCSNNLFCHDFFSSFQHHHLNLLSSRRATRSCGKWATTQSTATSYRLHLISILCQIHMHDRFRAATQMVQHVLYTPLSYLLCGKSGYKQRRSPIHPARCTIDSCSSMKLMYIYGEKVRIDHPNQRRWTDKLQILLFWMI